MKSSKIFLALFLAALLGCGVLSYLYYQRGVENQHELERLKTAHATELQNKESEHTEALENLKAEHLQQKQAQTADFDKRLDELRAGEREKIAAAYKEFENIFEGNRQTIEYINLLEGKVRSGQQLSKIEVEKLSVIATGLGHLQKQYQKPLQEFSELEAYFERQANKPSSLPAQQPKKSFFRNVFSKKYRENMREAEQQRYREQGERQAYESAQTEFTRVYSSAQKSMQAVNLDAEAEVKKLYSLIEEKGSASQQDLGDFFNKARKALRTHQDVLQFEPDAKLPPAPPAP